MRLVGVPLAFGAASRHPSLSPCWSSQGTSRRDEGEFLILSAQYGTERRHVDVTRRLKQLARRDLKFPIENSAFGVDPDRGRRKVLRIYARDPEGRERMLEYPEYDWVDDLGSVAGVQGNGATGITTGAADGSMTNTTGIDQPSEAGGGTILGRGWAAPK